MAERDTSMLRLLTLAHIAHGGKVCDVDGNALSEEAAIELLSAEGMDGLRVLPMTWLYGIPVYWNSYLLDARNGVIMRAEYFYELQACIDYGLIAWPTYKGDKS